mmetsp:Transcript_25835/g.63574  ORF Transcript_25835/g.63574 Transcript_25835/m.63574 type:complete len:538 (-) Transcript_25835:291-1904(-)
MLSTTTHAHPGAPPSRATGIRQELSEDEDPWAKTFAADVAGLKSEGISYQDSADFLRALVRKGTLRFTDIRDDPERFFLAHRLLARLAPEHGPGFWIRFTVQFNLFAGTVVALGGPAQLAELEAIQRAGQLGCFCLTEKLAGVNSGLVVNTVAEWDPRRAEFVIHSPHEGATKNWISQGLTAEKAVVIADLSVGGTRLGPHGFLIDMVNPATGRPAPGIVTGDMGRKTTGNDLDNAWVRFDRLRVPRAALLNRYGSVIGDEYVPAMAGIRTMDMIGQRLFTGRVAVAQAALGFARRLLDTTRAYSDAKQCTMRGEASPALSDVPQLHALYEEGGAALDKMDGFVAACELELRRCLVANKIPPPSLTQAIAVSKIRAVEFAIEFCFQLKQEVGSYALMDGTGFGHTDFLQCCKFAEGDSRILSQKLSRDAFGEFTKKMKSGGGAAGAGGALLAAGWSKREVELCEKIHGVVAAETAGGADKTRAWDAAWRDVYALAAAICDRVMGEWCGPSPTVTGVTGGAAAAAGVGAAITARCAKM